MTLQAAVVEAAETRTADSERAEEDDVFLPSSLGGFKNSQRSRVSRRRSTVTGQSVQSVGGSGSGRRTSTSSYRRMSVAQQQRRATFAAIPGAETQGFNNSGLIQNFRDHSTELGLAPQRNFDNFLSPIGMAPDAPVARSRSVNHLHVTPAIINPGDMKRQSMQHFGSNFGSNMSIASHGPKGAFPQPWTPSAGDRPMYDGPDLPSTDLPEDQVHLAPEPQPLPLDISRLHKISGYENVTSTCAQGPPLHPPEEEYFEHEKPEEKFSSVTDIDEEEAREALLSFVAEKCCYGKAAASDLQILKIQPSCALHYTLETYTESRSTTWEQEPYRGQFVDSQPDQAPGPWDIHCNSTQMFQNEVHHLEVPHTANINPCHGCTGHGWIRCHGCLGRGYLRCLSCSGTGREWHTDARGHRHMECCWHCHGTGRKRCFACGADGRQVCRTCQGYRQLKCYIKLTIEFENHVVEKVIEKTDMPEHLVKNVPGEVVFQQTQPKVWAISTYPDKDLCFESQRLVTDQQNRFKETSRIVMERQSIQAVPQSECAYVWKDECDGRFWVYGRDMKVYAPDYPQKCCWGCAIL